MSNKKIIYGGDLQKGDFVVIACKNYLQFGWYIGPGTNTLQYYNVSELSCTINNFDNWVKNNKVYYNYKFDIKGLTLKNLKKSYIPYYHIYRMMKYYGDPELIFTNQIDLDKYLKAKEILHKLNFIK